MSKKKKLIFILTILLVLTGCTKQLKDVNGKIVKNEKTGQTLPANILCRPTDKDIIKLYDKNKDEYIVKLDKQLKKKTISKSEYKNKIASVTDIKKLPTCKKFTPASGGYEGVWTTLFVKPLTWVIIQIGNLVKNYGLAVIIITLLIRLVLYPVTKKSAKQSELMKEAQPELAKIEKKYKEKNDQQSMQMKSQEMLAIYKKYGINPASGCIFGFIQIPLFIAFYESLYRLPVLFEDKFLFYKMAVTPSSAAHLGNYLYLILPVLVLIVTYFSFKLNSNATMNEDQAKQMNLMMYIMMIVIFITSFQMSTAIIIYWITNSAFTIVQNLIVKRSMKK